jgi:hypothetical protein
MNICKGRTKLGNECTRRINNGHYCFQHKHVEATTTINKVEPNTTIDKVDANTTINKVELNTTTDKVEPNTTTDKSIINKKVVLKNNEECCVCYEIMDKDKPLKCKHNVHLDCIIKSGKAQCPMCRASLKLPKNILNKINNISKKYKEEELEEEQNNIRQEFNIENRIDFILLNLLYSRII